jgi:adenylate cyclase
MRAGIALKIFSIALSLLLLLAFVSAMSSRNISRVRDEVMTVARYFAPLSRVASSIEIHQLQQELHLERALRYAEAGPAGAEGLARARQGIGVEGKAVDADLAEAGRLADAGHRDAQRAADREEFVALQSRLRLIDKEHHDFERLSLALVDALARRDTAEAGAIRKLLPNEDQQFNAELNAARAELQAYTETSAVEAADHQRSIQRLNLVVTVAAAVSGLLFATLITAGLVKPIQRLVVGTREVEGGRLDTHVAVTSQDEIGALTKSFNNMVEQLRMKERIKETFGKYVDPRIVERLITETGAATAAGERRVVTVFFSDIRGFTSIAEQFTPAVLVNVINRYFTIMSEPIVEKGGIIDKYIGDGIMAFWTPPFVHAEDHARLACVAALEQIERLRQFQAALPELLGSRKSAPEVSIRIGLATGDAVVGSIGSERARGFTVMGDTVNLGSRLEGTGKVYGTAILISDETRRMAGDAIEAREIDAIRVLGKSEPVRIFELLGAAGALDATTAKLRAGFEAGLTAYRAADWSAAAAHFEACLALGPHDGPSKVFLERVAMLRRNPPPPEWDGTWTMTVK